MRRLDPYPGRHEAVDQAGHGGKDDLQRRVDDDARVGGQARVTRAPDVEHLEPLVVEPLVRERDQRGRRSPLTTGRLVGARDERAAGLARGPLGRERGGLQPAEGEHQVHDRHQQQDREEAELDEGAAAVAPWAVRNKVQVGCFAITTDARALWKANNANTYDVLAAGQWIDDVPELPGVPPWPTKAADIELATGKRVQIDECAQASFYERKVVDFWRQHPGDKARLAAQATWMLWQPTFTVATDDAGRKGLADTLRRSAEPVFMVTLYVLALAGLFLAPRRFVALVISFEAYNTLMAMLFAGTVRYRVPWDFLLALLAAFPLARAWERVDRRRAYVDPARTSADS